MLQELNDWRGVASLDIMRAWSFREVIQPSSRVMQLCDCEALRDERRMPGKKVRDSSNTYACSIFM